tara:strand:- start:1279 stop:1659 length:381 start_codon:yes stop_codon:yes gene_type:complete
MPIAAIEPGQAMAIANFFLAIFFIFTISLPLLLITRGNKTKANREFLTATVNPWSQSNQNIELTPVVISGINPINEKAPKLELISGDNIDKNSESEEVCSTEQKDGVEVTEASPTVLTTNEEVLAA